MGCTPAPACKAVLSQATERWPNRSRASDGICASPKHTAQSPTSDHELGNAADLTHDPDNGVDAHAWAEELRLRADPRVKYIISNRRIWNPAVSPKWRAYSGPNPHEKHAHVSIHARSRTDTSPWFVDPPAKPTPQTAVPAPPQEDDMPKPTDFTSACVDPTTGGYFAQTAEGGVDGHNGARVAKTYKDYIAQVGVRTFLTLVPNGAGGIVQIATDGTRWNSADWN